MINYTLYKRTFEALKYAPGSPEREKLNESALTSAYMPSYKWIVRRETETKAVHYERSFRTKREA